MQVLSVFQERRIISDETARFEELLVRQRDFFVEEELKEKYKRLIAFVQQTEKNMSSAETRKFLPCQIQAIFLKSCLSSQRLNTCTCIHGFVGFAHHIRRCHSA